MRNLVTAYAVSFNSGTVSPPFFPLSVLTGARLKVKERLSLRTEATDAQ